MRSHFETTKAIKVDTQSYKTLSAKKDTVQRKWYIIDATDQVVGRLATEIAKIITGKHKPSYTPHVNCGDKIIVLNADQIRFTGKKHKQKTYVRYTGYPSGLRSRTPEDLLKKKPTEILHNAVRGMLPKNKLRDEFLKNLYLYTGEEHPHEAQQPEKIDL